MKAFRAALLFFKYKTWPELAGLVVECLENFRDAILSILFLLLCPIIIPFKFGRTWLEFSRAKNLDKFLEDPEYH